MQPRKRIVHAVRADGNTTKKISIVVHNKKTCLSTSKTFDFCHISHAIHVEPLRSIAYTFDPFFSVFLSVSSITSVLRVSSLHVDGTRKVGRTSAHVVGNRPGNSTIVERNLTILSFIDVAPEKKTKMPTTATTATASNTIVIGELSSSGARRFNTPKKEKGNSAPRISQFFSSDAPAPPGEPAAASTKRSAIFVAGMLDTVSFVTSFAGCMACTCRHASAPTVKSALAIPIFLQRFLVEKV